MGLSLSLPVAGRTHLLSKMALHAMLFLPAYVLDLVLVYALFKLPPIDLVYLIPAGPIFLVFGFSAGIFFDLKRPILTWTHPQQAMKNNANAYMGMAGMFVLLAGMAMPAALLLFAGVSPLLIGCLAPALPLVLDLVLFPRLLWFADFQYAGGLEAA